MYQGMYNKFCTKLLFYINQTKGPSQFFQSFSSIPKNNVQRVKWPKIKKKINERKSPCKKVSLQVIGPGSKGMPSAIELIAGEERLIFNCGEGLRRLYGRQQAIFITHNSWRNISGILENILTHEIDGSFHNYIYAHNHVRQNIESISEDLKILPDFRDLDLVKFYKNDAISIKAIRIDSKERSNKQFENPSYAFICLTKEYTQVADIDKLVLKGVPVGKPLKKLLLGNAITLDDGRIVTPEDVGQIVHPPKAIIVVDIPDENYLDSLLAEKAFFPHQSGSDTSKSTIPTFIVHFTPLEVMKSTKYANWVKKFPSSTSHLVINELSSCSGFYHPNFVQNLLHQALPKCFPLLVDSEELFYNIPKRKFRFNDEYVPPIQETSLLTNEFDFPGKTHKAASKILIHIQPPSKEFDLEHYQELRMNVLDFTPEAQKALSEVEPLIQEHRQTCKVRDFPEVVFLGTGSAGSCKYRSASGIIINLNPERSILLDCGPNFLSQLIRLHGFESFEEALLKISVVYISHKHFDHHGGLTTLLKARREALARRGWKRPIYIILADWEKDFLLNNGCYVNLNDVIFIPKAAFSTQKETKKEVDIIKKLTGLERINIVYVKHCGNSTAIALTHKDGWKIAYSGDCRPSMALCDIGKNCDLLIHEATCLEDEPERAMLTKHCTSSEAILVGNTMKAKTIILTHFSKRYAKIPEDIDSYPKNTTIAFDFMKVTLDDLPILPLLNPVYKELFLRQTAFLDHLANSLDLY